MNGSVLVLNANYEPINICSLQRALGLILMEKASLVANGWGGKHCLDTKRGHCKVDSFLKVEYSTA